jgi:hypothetical protein
MINFFRKIRKQLADDNKPFKYMRYAIGEIVLVVIGILIALSINNWNENQKQYRLEINLLTEMKENLLNDLEDIRHNIEEDIETMYSNKLILNHIENGFPYEDSLSVHFGRLPRTSIMVVNNSAYENLKSIGFNLIGNDLLRRRITNLYSARYEYIDDVNINANNKIIWDLLHPMLLNIIDSNVVLEDAIPTDFESLQNNAEFKEVLKWHIFAKEFVINLNKDIELEIAEIIELINKEIRSKS